MDDQEYAEMVVRAQADAEKTGTSGPTSGPSLAFWTPEVNALAAVIDKLSTLIGTMSDGKTKLEPYTRPKTLVERLKAQHENTARWEKHKALTARVIQQPPDAGQ